MLDEEASEEIGEELYYLDYETVIETKNFDDESLTLLRELGVDV